MTVPKLNIFLVLLTLLIVLSIIPIAILIRQSIGNLDIIKGASKEAIGTIVREQSDQIYKSRARDLAQRISDFLKSSELDLRILAQISKTPEAYLNFSRAHSRWLKHKKSFAQLYKELLTGMARKLLKLLIIFSERENS